MKKECVNCPGAVEAFVAELTKLGKCVISIDDLNALISDREALQKARASLPVGVPDADMVPSPSSCGDAWTNIKPEREGAYWIRGNGLDQPALIQVKMGPDELECNLHMRTTEPDFGYGYAISQLNDDFEWLGPLTTAAPTVKAEQVDERDVLLAEARTVISAVLAECDLETELSWMCERASKGRRIYVDDRALSYAPAPSLPAAGSTTHSLDFIIENRNGIRVIERKHGGCGPASSSECEMLDALSAQQSAQDVSVPREWRQLMERAADNLQLHAEESKHPGQYGLIAELRAILNGGEA